MCSQLTSWVLFARVDDTELADMEKELCRLPAVNAARIVTDDIGRPTELHILASAEKSPKQIARDVQSVAMATDCTSRAICFGLFSGLARMCSSVGRPTSSATIRAALTAGSRQSSFSMTASSVSSTTPNHTHAVNGKHMGRSGDAQHPAHPCQPSVNGHSVAR